MSKIELSFLTSIRSRVRWSHRFGHSSPYSVLQQKQKMIWLSYPLECKLKWLKVNIVNRHTFFLVFTMTVVPFTDNERVPKKTGIFSEEHKFGIPLENINSVEALYLSVCPLGWSRTPWRPRTRLSPGRRSRGGFFWRTRSTSVFAGSCWGPWTWAPPLAQCTL